MIFAKSLIVRVALHLWIVWLASTLTICNSQAVWHRVTLVSIFMAERATYSVPLAPIPFPPRIPANSASPLVLPAQTLLAA
jgi:hypothetical protein